MIRCAIVGATGLVGSTFLKVIEEKKLPIDEFVLLASSRSKGKIIHFLDKDYIVKELNENSFDIVISSLAFHYIKNFEPIVKNISKWLKNNGCFIFSVEHPVFTSYGSQDWIYDENGNILHAAINCNAEVSELADEQD